MKYNNQQQPTMGDFAGVINTKSNPACPISCKS